MVFTQKIYHKRNVLYTLNNIQFCEHRSRKIMYIFGEISQGNNMRVLFISDISVIFYGICHFFHESTDWIFLSSRSFASRG